jgi:putative transposase
MLVTKAYRYRIYPNAKQKEQFAKTFGCIRFYWNHLVAEFNSYSSDKKPQYKSVAEMRDEFMWMKDVSAVALQQKERDFHATRKQFFNKQRKVKLGRMKFRHKNDTQSFRMTNQNFVLLDNKLKITKIGLLKIQIDRRPPAGSRHLSVTISMNKLGEY